MLEYMAWAVFTSWGKSIAHASIFIFSLCYFVGGGSSEGLDRDERHCKFVTEPGAVILL